MPDVGALFGFGLHPLEIVLRRDAGSLGIADILVLLLIAVRQAPQPRGGPLVTARKNSNPFALRWLFRLP
jgi:hypothetical protein